MHSNKVLQDKIRRNYAKLTRSQVVLSHYILEHGEEIPFLSSTALARKVNVSEATVNRFCLALGYSGYSEFLKEMQRWIQIRLAPSELFEKTVQKKKDNLYHQIIDLDIQNLNETKDNIVPSQMDEIVQLLTNSKRIFIIGLLSSFGLACLMHYYLSRIFRRVFLLDTARGILFDHAIDIGPKDTLLAISISRYSKTTLQIVGFARKHGCPIIAITDSILSPLAQISDHVLQVKIATQTFFASYTSVVSVINCLITGISLANSKRSSKALKEIEERIPQNEIWVVKRSFLGDFMKKARIKIVLP